MAALISDVADIADGLLVPQQFNKLKGTRYTFDPFSAPPRFSDLLGNGAASGASAAANLLQTNSSLYEWFVLPPNGQTITVPIFDRVNGLGLDFAQDLVNGSGHELRFSGGQSAATMLRGKHSYTVATDRDFFARVKMRGNRLDLMNGTEAFMFGFVKSDPYRSAFVSYANYAVIKVGPGTAPNADIAVKTNLNGAGVQTFNSTKKVQNDTSFQLEVRISAKGEVVFLVDGVLITAPKFTFNSGNVVIPVGRFNQGSTFINNLFYQEFESGFLPEKGI